MIRFATISTLSLLVIGLSISVLIGSDDKSKQQTVSLSDIIDGRVAIIGQLGLPVGELIELRGIWTEPAHLSGHKEPRRFEVTHVNGKQLLQPVSYQPVFVNQWNHKHIIHKTGDVWDMIGYEEVLVREHARLRDRLKQISVADPYSGIFATILGEVTVVTKN